MKLMLDECMTTRASRVIIEALKLYKPPITAHFLPNYLGGPGALDTDWTKRLADEGDWTVVTCDHRNARGQKAKLRGPPLHLILPARKITGFFFGGSIASVSGFEKARAVIYNFHEIWEQALTAVPGSRFRITRSSNGYKFSAWEVNSILPIF